MDAARSVVVWGNCQAPAVADLLRVPLAEAGLDVLRLPPVYLVDDADLAVLRPALDRCAAFVTQPVSEALFGGGRGSDTLTALLPADAVVVSFPVSYWTGPFPFQVHGHGADGVRVNAAVTDYHDVRAAVAAQRGMSAAEAVDWWPAPAADDVRTWADASLAELHRREHGLDVATSDLITGPDALWTMTHPGNAALSAIARRIADRLAVSGVGDGSASITAPQREFLGERQAPVDAAVAHALGWPDSAGRPDWIVSGVRRPLIDLLREQLAQYRERPDVVADIVSRHGARVRLLGGAH